MSMRNIVLGLGIFVIYALVLWQGIQAFYPVPEWDEYCESKPLPTEPFGALDDCSYPDGLREKENACYQAGGYFQHEYDAQGCVTDGVCDECQLEFDEARDAYSRNIFIITLILGVITFVIGLLILKVEPVGSALLASGVWAVFYGTVSNWRNFGNITRFVLLLVVLIILIWIALRLNTGRKKKNGFWMSIGFGKK